MISPTTIATSPASRAVAVPDRTAFSHAGVRSPECRTASGSVATARETFSAIV
jgi:hypothetical protein